MSISLPNEKIDEMERNAFKYLVNAIDKGAIDEFISRESIKVAYDRETNDYITALGACNDSLYKCPKCNKYVKRIGGYKSPVRFIHLSDDPNQCKSNPIIELVLNNTVRCTHYDKR